MATESALLLGRGRGSYWVRANPPSAFPDEDEGAMIPAPPTPPRPRKAATGPRFVEPCRLEAAQRAALLAALESEGLGDDDSRQIFLAALEYDLAGCRQLMAGPKSPNAEVQLPSPPEPSPDTAMAPTAPNGMASLTAPAHALPASVVVTPPVLPALESASVTPSPSPVAVSISTTPPPPSAAFEFGLITPLHSTAPDSALLALAHLAGDLAEVMAKLTPAQREILQRALEASDCLARGYGERYLDTLRLELLHLHSAFSASGSQPQSVVETSAASSGLGPKPATATSTSSALETQVPTATSPPSPPPVPAEVQRFLRRVADAFNDCFEGEPSLAAGAPFPRILQVLGAITGLTLPKDERTLSEILT